MFRAKLFCFYFSSILGFSFTVFCIKKILFYTLVSAVAQRISTFISEPRKSSLISESQTNGGGGVREYRRHLLCLLLLYILLLLYFKPSLYYPAHIWRIYTVLGLRVIQCGTFYAFSGLNCFLFFFPLVISVVKKL